MRSLGVLALVASVGTSGCYSLEPVRGTPVPGSRIALDVNDAGRVALGVTMGPSIDRVEGRLIDNTNGEYLLGVTSVTLIKNAGVQTWKGEQVAVQPQFVSTVYERKFNVVRTALVAAAAVGGVVAIASTNLFTSGTDPDKGADGDTLKTNRRPRLKHVTLLSIPLSRIPIIGRR